MASTDISNQQLVDAAEALGFKIAGPFDASGAQNSEFKRKLLGLITSSGQWPQGKETDQVWEQLKTAARYKPDPNQTASDQLLSALKAYGVPDDQIRAAWDKATEIASHPSGLQPGGREEKGANGRTVPFHVEDLISAIPQVLAGSTIVPNALKAAGLDRFISQVTPPAQGPQFDDSLQAGRAQAKTGATAPIATAPAAARPTPAAKAVVDPAAAAAAQSAAAQAAKDKAANPANWNDDQVKTWLKTNLGADAWFIDIPDVWNAMNAAVKAGKGVTGADEAFKSSSFYQQTSASARLWYQKEREDPASVARDVATQTQAIQGLGQTAGITLDPERARQMAYSYLRFGWTQTDLQRALGAEWHYDPNTKDQAAQVTKMKQDAKNWLVPLSDQAIQTWGQGLISGTTTDAQWQQYLRDSAKSMLPQMADLIDAHAGDPTFTVDHFADPYKQHAANLLGIQTDQIDLNDPGNKWRQALDTVDSKTGEKRIMSLSEWDTKIKTDPAYGYDKTTNGISDGLALAQSLKASFGF